MFNFFNKTDEHIQNDVIRELKWDPSIRSEEIGVTAHNGIITLRGSVPHYCEKMSAEEAVQRIGGVRAVADELEVKLLADYERSDEDIAEAALTAMTWSYNVPTGIKVLVDKAWVTLSGEVDWDYERTAAGKAVDQLMGVCGVTNNITLKAMVQESDVKNLIEAALKRSAEGEGRKITVDVDGNRVTLSGDVQSLSEMEDARLAAWNAPGVVMVNNCMRLAHSH